MNLTKNNTNEKIRLFTPGPTPISQRILDISAQQLPYNRTKHFSQITFDILAGLKGLFSTKGDVVIFASSGTGAMEASILNFIHQKDHVLIINGGTFGQRWVDLCAHHKIPYTEMCLAPGASLSIDLLDQQLSSGQYRTLLLNSHETSTGQLYDTKSIGELTHRYGVFFIVDAISTICADPFLMDDWYVDVAILSSQKGLALPPGLSFLALNETAKQRLQSQASRSFYFDIKDYLDNQKRGQMPFTPVIGHFLMLHEQLKWIKEIGMTAVIARHSKLAEYFRESVVNLPFSFVPHTPSNALSALKVEKDINAFELTKSLASKYNCVVAPNGGSLKDSVFRVSHLGQQTTEDIDFLVGAIESILDHQKNKKEPEYESNHYGGRRWQSAQGNPRRHTQMPYRGGKWQNLD